MKKIGIIGGLGPEATVDYYQRIINSFKSGNSDLNYPEIIVYSVNMSEFIGLMRANEYEKATIYLLQRIESLKLAGADFAVLSANTPHQLFDRIISKSTLPLISIVEATCDEARRKGLRRPGLFGTDLTMKASFYPEVFSKQGLEVVIPEAQDMELINEKLFTEIELGIFKDDTRQQLIGIIEKMVYQQHIDSLILGCTEFPLILDKESYAGIPMLNTTQIHVEAIVKECHSNASNYSLTGKV